MNGAAEPAGACPCSSWPGRLAANGAAACPSSQFELADTVQLDQVDNTVLAQWERVKALLADRQWDEAVEILRQLTESSEGKLLGVTSRRYVSLPEWCQLQLAALPPEALKLYRARVDPVAQKWYEQGIAQRNRRLLQNVVDQAFASRYGDEALMALGEMALESGDYVAARWYWERILPAEAHRGTGRPDCRQRGPAIPIPTSIWRPCVPAWCWCRSSKVQRAGRRRNWTSFTRLHPDAHGRLGGQEGPYAVLLKKLWPRACPGRRVARSKLAHVCRQSGAEQDRLPTGRCRRRGLAHCGCRPRLPPPTARWSRQHRRKTRTSR